MEFAIGQYVCHPSYGPGQIVDIEEQTVADTPRDYYVIRIFTQNLTVRIPISAVKKVKLRSVISKKQTEKVLATLKQEPNALPSNHKERGAKLKKLIFSGRPVQIAQAVRELTWRKFRKGTLNTSDKKLLDQGKEILVAEVAVATDKEETSVLTSINSALWTALEKRQEPKAA